MQEKLLSMVPETWDSPYSPTTMPGKMLSLFLHLLANSWRVSLISPSRFRLVCKPTVQERVAIPGGSEILLGLPWWVRE